MLNKSLILILILVAAVCCFSAELPGNAYLPPFRNSHRTPDESELESINPGIPFDGEPFERYAPIFVDYPGVHHLLRQQQEYSLDLPFEEKPLEFESPTKQNW
ncbi:hypothetical protein KR009_011467 [Drosophila setifemur]|nr:hypothetical protein KR009_011467 [Drosophila setifemur]